MIYGRYQHPQLRRALAVIDHPMIEQAHFSTNVRGSRSLAPAPSKEDTLEGERELKTRLDLFDTFSASPDEDWGR
jgi:hypothetical protein